MSRDGRSGAAMRVLVTGGAGFIGSFLVERLMAAGDRVRVLDNLDPQVHPDGAPAYLPHDAELIVGDVRDHGQCRKALDGANVVAGCRPYLSPHFNLTVELPLKAIVRGYTYEVIPIGWRQRTRGTSSLRLQEMGSRYLFIVLYVWLEKLLTRGDYRRPHGETFAPWDVRSEHRGPLRPS